MLFCARYYKIIVMRAQIHPNYNSAAQVVCSCGNVFSIGSTKDNIHVDLCNKCHPFYTGQHRFVDTASRIQRFELKRQVAKPKKEKKAEVKEPQQPRTLKEMLESLKH